MRIEIDGHVWAGVPLAWGDDLALLSRTMGPVLADPAAAAATFDAMRAGEVGAVVSVLSGVLQRAPALALEWLRGWTRDGVDVTPQSLAGLGWEPIVAAAHVVRAHGFFSPSPGLLRAAADLLPDFEGMVADLRPTAPEEVAPQEEAAAAAVREAAARHLAGRATSTGASASPASTR